MAAIVFWWLRLSVLIFTTFLGVSGSKITLTPSSPAIQPLLTQTLTLTCKLEDTASSSSVIGKRILPSPTSPSLPSPPSSSLPLPPSPSRRGVPSTPDNARYVTSIFLFQNNNDIAGVTEHIPVHAMGNVTSLNVSGGIAGTQGDKGFLEVSVAYPTSQHGGNYTCVIAAIDDVGHSVTYTASVDVDVTSPTVDDLVQHIYKQDKDNKVIVGQLQNQISHYKTTMDQLQSQVIQNKVTMDNQQSQLAHMQQKETQQQTEIASLKSQLDIARHLESGVVTFGNIGTTHTGALTSRSQTVKFTTPYTQTPTVHLALLDDGAWHNDPANFYTTLTSVDVNGFTVQVRVRDTTSGHYLSYLHVSWLSFP